MNGLCVGNIAPVGQFPGLCLQVRSTYFSRHVLIKNVQGLAAGSAVYRSRHRLPCWYHCCIDVRN